MPVNSFTDMELLFEEFNSLQVSSPKISLEEKVRKEVKHNYYKNKYKLLALHNLPNHDM